MPDRRTQIPLSNRQNLPRSSTEPILLRQNPVLRPHNTTTNQNYPPTFTTRPGRTSGLYTRPPLFGRVTEATHESINQIPVRPSFTSSKSSTISIVTPCRVTDCTRCGNAQSRSEQAAFANSRASTPAATRPPSGTTKPRKYRTSNVDAGEPPAVLPVTGSARRSCDPGQPPPSKRTRKRRLSTLYAPDGTTTPSTLTTVTPATGPGRTSEHTGPRHEQTSAKHTPQITLYHRPPTSTGSHTRRPPRNVDPQRTGRDHGRTATSTGPNLRPVHSHNRAAAILS